MQANGNELEEPGPRVSNQPPRKGVWNAVRRPELLAAAAQADRVRWSAASMEEKGRALIELLDLVDAIGRFPPKPPLPPGLHTLHARSRQG